MVLTLEKLLIDDSCMRGLLPAISKCASTVCSWISRGRMVVIRFNDDCDGITSGMAVCVACKSYAEKFPKAKRAVEGYQVPSAVYAASDAFDDVSRARGAGLGLGVIIVDLGANKESVEGLAALKDSGAGVCIIDHHPPDKAALSLCDAFVSSHSSDPTGAHTAGLLAFEVAERIAPGAASKAWVSWSLQSDKSSLATGEKYAEAAEALDYLAHFSEKSAGIDYYLEKMSDKKTVELAAALAKKSGQNALDAALKYSVERKVSDSFVIVVVDLSKAVRKGAYPPKGRCLNLVQDYFCLKHKDSAVISLGRSSDSISIRANAAAMKQGFHSNPLIDTLKAEFPHAVSSGGGHAAAASIRFDPQFKESVLERLAELASDGASWGRISGRKTD